ncbi:hypothetical protein Cgig2_002432 [Carnegiea gigantea]|uniref:non-specific serine/threonine protein kinase n=1 Tax=Carnegiea gigantea TaxID=171969 RepID=A0A9Q1KT09_9CARY|nr:hypothetical protein Cgig2_002432 [Carnegiea gigantea]
MGSDESNPGLLQVLVDRCSELEASQASLRAQLVQLAAEEEQSREREKVNEELTSYSGGLTFPGNFRGRSPYGHVLQSMGHAVYVTRAPSGEIIFWNHSAERLYGWKDYEVIGRCFWDFLIEEEYVTAINKIMEKLRFGQFPFKKRSGEIFTAIVTKSPMYEDGQLVGVITVASDAAVFNNVNSNQPREPGFNMKRIQWQPRPQIASVPQMASSISDLASKVLSRRRGDDVSGDGEGSVSDAEESRPARQGIDVAKNISEGCNCHKEESVIAQPAKIAAKLLAKLQIKSSGNNGEASDGNFMQNSFMQKAKHEPCCSQGSTETTSHNPAANVRGSSFPGKRTYAHVNENITSNGNALEKASSSESFSKECHECFKEPKLQTSLPTLGLQVSDKGTESELENPKAGEVEDAAERQGGARNHAGSGESHGSSPGSSSSKGEYDLNSMVDPDIRWEDLQLAEEIGQGSYAVVYRGIWKGSVGCCSQSLLWEGLQRGDSPGLQKRGKFRNDIYGLCSAFANRNKFIISQCVIPQIDIMRRLRHPNVLLFMGACYSQERLAIVTEYLPRGSLFKILHRSNQMLDIRKRLKMALDVAKGMNYLHRRHPPIVHRDLKSSNLLVDKNWTVKVGDFGLSKLKNATFLTAKSGGGTPQWMAPEVLRNDPSNEKSDVFSFGVILWELMTVKIPWASLNSLQVVGVVGFMDRRLEIPEDLDPRISSIISDCWQSNPGARPSFQDIIQRMNGILHSVPATIPTPVRRNPPS